MKRWGRLHLSWSSSSVWWPSILIQLACRHACKTCRRYYRRQYTAHEVRQIWLHYWTLRIAVSLKTLQTLLALFFLTQCFVQLWQLQTTRSVPESTWCTSSVSVWRGFTYSALTSQCSIWSISWRYGQEWFPTTISVICKASVTPILLLSNLMIVQWKCSNRTDFASSARVSNLIRILSQPEDLLYSSNFDILSRVDRPLLHLYPHFLHFGPHPRFPTTWSLSVWSRLRISSVRLGGVFPGLLSPMEAT